MSTAITYPAQGWLFSTRPHCDARAPEYGDLYAVAMPNCDDALEALEQWLDPMLGTVTPVCRLSARALTHLGMRPGEIMPVINRRALPGGLARRAVPRRRTTN